jgi:tight adherence protein B
MSGRILSAVPFAVFVLLWFINQKYMGQFFDPKNLLCGGGALVAGVVMIAVGYVIMMKIADIQV